jgi:Macrocin-O-methyltransferase (TylF)
MRASIITDTSLWDAYNLLVLGPDIGRIRKMLVRYRLFEQVIDVPGDIIECGVFKGAGLMYWAKLLEIFSPNSRKRVIGFDGFRPFLEVPLRPEEYAVARKHDEIVSGVSRREVEAAVDVAGLAHRVELIEGNIETTAVEYGQRNAGTRISLLHLDLDTYSGTKAALTSLYPLVSPGGLVIFDEYGIPGMGETDAVDEFFAGTKIRIIAVPHSESPTAYLIKS